MYAKMPVFRACVGDSKGTDFVSLLCTLLYSKCTYVQVDLVCKSASIFLSLKTGFSLLPDKVDRHGKFQEVDYHHTHTCKLAHHCIRKQPF